MSESVCAYCQAPGVMTNEHLWPASLHRRLVHANGSGSGLFWLRRINAELKGEPQIKDVCRKCNNGTLSNLDDYICELFDRYFARILERYETIIFEYDYHKLKRWLLKLAFNCARIHSSIDCFVYPPLLDYINGRSTAASRYIELFVQLSYPGVIPPEKLTDPELGGAPTIWLPADLRVGLLGFRVHGVGEKVLRAIHLRSFSFFLAFFEPSTGRTAAKDFSDEFRRVMRETVLLSPSRSAVRLQCDGSDAWASFSGARENQLVRVGE